MDSNSPTGSIAVDPAQLFGKVYKSGNPESARQTSIRLRIAEELLRKASLENGQLKEINSKLVVDSQAQKLKLEVLNNEKNQEIEQLQLQLNQKKREDARKKIDAVMDLLKKTAADSKPSPPFSFSSENEIAKGDAESQTDDWLCRSINHRSITVADKIPSNAVVGTVREDMLDVIKYQKYAEEIAKLKNENFFLNTQLKLMSNKLENFNLQEAQKCSLEHRVVLLNDMQECLIKENERLKELLAANMNEDRKPTKEMREVVALTLNYQNKLDELKAELDHKTKLLENQYNINEILSSKLDSANDKCQILEDNVTESVIEHQEKRHAEMVKKFTDKIIELEKRLASNESSSQQSDNTKILHLAMNPLDIAINEYKEFQAQKNKRKIDFDDEDDIGVSLRKKQRAAMDKEIADLRFQLHKLEKEKERALTIQSDLVKKYRAFVTALSGLQIKMKDDGLVQVESIFDPGNFFVFRVHDWGKTISLLETDYANQWANQIHEYLVGRNSTPAFLAAVTLSLDERSQNTTSVTFYEPRCADQ